MGRGCHLPCHCGWPEKSWGGAGKHPCGLAEPWLATVSPSSAHDCVRLRGSVDATSSLRVWRQVSEGRLAVPRAGTSVSGRLPLLHFCSPCLVRVRAGGWWPCHRLQLGEGLCSQEAALRSELCVALHPAVHNTCMGQCLLESEEEECKHLFAHGRPEASTQGLESCASLKDLHQKGPRARGGI